jgi:hypothetical protein
VAWEINYSGTFGDWWTGLTIGEQVAIEARIDLLASGAPISGVPPLTPSLAAAIRT